MTDASYSADPSDDEGAPSDGVDLNRTPLARNAFGSSASGYDPSALRVDLYGNPVDRNPYFPDPADPNLDMGQVLYHMASGAKPEDFHPALQPLARGFSIAFEPQPPLGPGLLGSLENIRATVRATPKEDVPGAEIEDAGSDDVQVAPAAVGQRPRFSTTYPRTLGPTVERHVAEYDQAHRLKPGNPEYLDPDLIKAMIRQEAGHDYDSLLRDPMQVNNLGDWAKEKSRLGLSKGAAPGADAGIKAGIAWLRTKAYPRDDNGMTHFIGWQSGVRAYKGRNDLGTAYAKSVMNHLAEVKRGR
jgi:hypothetical protein